MDGIYTDPIGWIVEQYTWFLHSPPALVIANLAFWPVVFGVGLARAWYLDRRDIRRHQAELAAAGGYHEWRRKKLAAQQ